MFTGRRVWLLTFYPNPLLAISSLYHENNLHVRHLGFVEILQAIAFVAESRHQDHWDNKGWTGLNALFVIFLYFQFCFGRSLMFWAGCGWGLDHELTLRHLDALAWKASLTTRNPVKWILTLLW